jgi:hypothetical protein
MLPIALAMQFPQATTGLAPISNRRALLNTLLYASLIPKSYNRPSTSYRRALLRTLLHATV